MFCVIQCYFSAPMDESLVVELCKQPDTFSLYNKKCQSCDKYYLSNELLVKTVGNMPEYIAQFAFKRWSMKSGQVVSLSQEDCYHLCDSCLAFFGFEQCIMDPFTYVRCTSVVHLESFSGLFTEENPFFISE